MKVWIWAAATMAVATATALAPAAEPSLPLFRFSQPRANDAEPTPAARPVTHLAPVRSAAWRQDKPVPPPVAAPAPMPAISAHSGIGQGGAAVGSGIVANGAVISQTAWNNEHVYTGYVYGPGSCDYTAPCTDHLWDGYCQRPHRCGGHGGLFHHHRACGYGGGCSTCGVASSCDVGCSSGCGRHHFGGCHGFRLHGRHCNTGCDSCSSSLDACGCGHRHFGGHRLFGKCGGWFHNLCNACDGGMSCGCAAPIGGGSLNPETVPTPSIESTPAPMADDGKSARAPLLNRYFPWSIK